MDQDFYRTLLDNMFDGVYFVDPTRRITYWNAGAERISGFSAEEVVGHRCSENILRHVDDQGTELCIVGCPLKATMNDGKVREAEVYMHHKAGHRVPVVVRAAPMTNEAGEIIGAVEIFVQGRAAQRAEELIAKLKSEALHDPLTGLGNRGYGASNLEAVLEDVTQNEKQAGLLFVDIDFFKKVNDSYGHNVGDDVLKMVAQTLANGLRRGDLVSRWGGEEFVVLLPNSDDKSLAQIAERLRMLVEHSWVNLGNKNVRVTISVGGSMMRTDDDERSVLDRADLRLYNSKHTGRNRVTLHCVTDSEASGATAPAES